MSMNFYQIADICEVSIYCDSYCVCLFFHVVYNKTEIKSKIRFDIK